jgi:signal peptidase I
MEKKIALDLHERTCLPWTVYWLDNDYSSVKQGDLLVFVPGELMKIPNLPDEEQPFTRTKVTKLVMGFAGDKVDITVDDVFINGESIVSLIPRVAGIPVKQKYIHPITSKNLGKEPEDFVRSFVVPEDNYFMLSTEERSFDGRYWGTLPKNKVIGKAYAVF